MQKYDPAPLNWEGLRKHPGDLRTICLALAPPTQTRACADFLLWSLRTWNKRKPRFDGHLSGEWQFASHSQLVEWGAATSARTSESVLRRLSEWQEGRENAELIEKRKAHLGSDKNKLHIRPSNSLLKIMDTLGTCYRLLPDKQMWAEFLTDICRPIEEATPQQDLDAHTLELRRIARKLRRDRKYGSHWLGDDLGNLIHSARWRADNPSTAKTAVKASGSTAKSAAHNQGSTAKMAVTDLETGTPTIETGGKETGKPPIASNSSTETGELLDKKKLLAKIQAKTWATKT